MINFSQFENDLVSYFGTNSDTNHPYDMNHTARYIANLYDSYMLTGRDANYGNIVSVRNKLLLENALRQSFTLAYNSNRINFFSDFLYTGLVGYWTGGQLQFFIPPPGSIQVVSNNVTFPGNKQFLNVINTTDGRYFPKQLISVFKNHLLTIRGITVSLVPQPTGGPIPIPFPWNGYI